MNTIGERIKYLRKKHNLSMAKFAEIIGASPGNVGDWESEKRKSTPSAQFLVSIAENFDVSLDWLMTGKERLQPKIEKSESPIFFDEEWEVVSQFKRLGEVEKAFIKECLRFAQYKSQQPPADPRNTTTREEAAGYVIDENDADEYTGSAPIWGEAAAGIPIESIRMYEGKRLRVPAKYTKCFAVKVKGDSMKDSGILNGGYVIVRSQNMVEDNDVALMMIENEATIKRFHLRDNDVVLISDNTDFEPMVFHRSREMQVVGKVVYYIPPEKAEIIEEWSE